MSAVPKVYSAIVAVSAEIAKTGISKDRRNEQQHYKFRGVDDVYNALAPVLSKHGLVVLPRIIARECVERTTQKGSALFYVTVEAEFDFVAAEDGSKHVVRTFGEAMDSADKATNKAMSAAYKYAAFQAFCIGTEGDNDADATTHDPVEPRRVELPPQVPPVPAGYDDWLADMEMKAADGIGALESAFKASKIEYRRRVTSIDSQRWNRLKAKAPKGEAVPA